VNPGSPRDRTPPGAGAEEADTGHPIVAVLGPTAGGKSTLALDLAGHLPGGGEIVGADSMQIYVGMDVGTAKPSPEEQARIPHHLVDVVPPTESFTVDDWRRQAEAAIEDIRRSRRWPVVVQKALLSGMFEGPKADPDFRAALRDVEPARLHERVAAIDPVSADRIHRNDARRLVRALEVHHLTGRPLSAWQQQWDDEGRAWRSDSIVIGLVWSAERLARRINARVRAMAEAGLVEEVRRLEAAGRLGPQAREALGYKQVLDHLAGRCSEAEAIERTAIETRRFARKQRTWLKRFRSHPRSCWLDAETLDEEQRLHAALDFARRHAEIGTTPDASGRESGVG